MADAVLSDPLKRAAPRLGFSYWSGWPWLAKWGGYLVLGLTYFPLLWLAVLSVSERPLSGIPYPLSLANYRALVDDSQWAGPLAASLILAALVAVICMMVAALVGRAIPHVRYPGAVVMVVVLPLFVPGMSMGAALFIFLRSVLGLKLGFWSILLGHLVWAMPFALLTVLVLTTRFDQRLLEAAEDLGASAWQRFWDIEFPLLRPGIIGAGLFGFLLSFNELLRSMFLRGIDTTMPIWNWFMAASQQSQVPIIFGLSTIILLISLPLLAGFFWLLFVRLERP